jgi:hypothetical protein
MARYPVKPVPPGYFVAPVTLTDATEAYVAGQIFFGDDEREGEIIDLVPFSANGQRGLERRVKIFRRRDEAVTACEVMRQNGSRIVPT